MEIPEYPGSGKTKTDLTRTYALMAVETLSQPGREWVEQYIRLIENGLNAARHDVEAYKALAEVYRAQVKHEGN